MLKVMLKCETYSQMDSDRRMTGNFALCATAYHANHVHGEIKS